MKSNLTLLLLLILIASCTIQKRVHNRGWHVQWNAKRNVSNQDSKEEKSTIALTEMSDMEDEKFSRNLEPVKPSFEQSIEEQSPLEELDVQYQLDEVKKYETSTNEHSNVHPTDSVVYKIRNGQTSGRNSVHESGYYSRSTILFVLAGISIVLAIFCWLAVITAADIFIFAVMFLGAAALGLVGLILLFMAIITLASLHHKNIG